MDRRNFLKSLAAAGASCMIPATVAAAPILVKSTPLPEVPAAVSIPFRNLPVGSYIRGPRYEVIFDKMILPKIINFTPHSFFDTKLGEPYDSQEFYRKVMPSVDGGSSALSEKRGTGI